MVGKMELKDIVRLGEERWRKKSRGMNMKMAEEEHGRLIASRVF